MEQYSALVDAGDPFACLYVIEVARGRIKVGFTCSPKSRLTLHREYALAYGGKPGREWASPPGSGTRALEAELIEFCADRARQKFRNEFFAGVPFLAAVRCAAALCNDRDTLGDFERARRKGEPIWLPPRVSVT